MTAGVGSWRVAPSSTDHGRGHAPQARHQNSQLLALAQQARQPDQAAAALRLRLKVATSLPTTSLLWLVGSFSCMC